ncbi:MAG: alpha-glucosidase [Spirochaetes bacterium]|nr:MAG: alpha-glucosidase [Spirochaetota bacterium]
MVRMEPWHDGFAIFFEGKHLFCHSSRSPALQVGRVGNSLLSRLKAKASGKTKASGESLVWKPAGACSILVHTPDAFHIRFDCGLGLRGLLTSECLHLGIAQESGSQIKALRLSFIYEGELGPVVQVGERGFRSILVNSDRGPWYGFKAEERIAVSQGKEHLKIQVMPLPLEVEIAAGATRLARISAFTARRWNSHVSGQDAALLAMEKAHFLQAGQGSLPPGITEILASLLKGPESFVSLEVGGERIAWIDEGDSKDPGIYSLLRKSFMEGYGFSVPILREFPSAASDLAMFGPWFVLPSLDVVAPRGKRAFLRAASIFVALERYRNWRREAWRKDGIPFWAPSSLYYEGDPALLDRIDSLMCGPELLIGIPKEKEDRVREVLLPEDTWIHLWTSRQHEGGRTVVDAPRGLPAVFYKKTGKHAPYFDSLRRIACRLP